MLNFSPVGELLPAMAGLSVDCVKMFGNTYPARVRAAMRAALIAVAFALPKRFAGGGYWEAMKGDMTGWFELLTSGRNLGLRRAQRVEMPRASSGPQSGPRGEARGSWD